MRVKLHTSAQRKGGASLLTTMVLAVALIGIISGLTALSVRELRQASNTEQSKRALAGAESYASKLAAKMDDNPAFVTVNECDGSKKTNLGSNLVVTCATANQNDATETIGQLDVDHSFQIDLSKAKDDAGNTKTVDGMSVEWGPGDVSAIATTYLPSKWPSLGSGGFTAPGAPELTYTWWKDLTPASWNNSGDDFGFPMAKVLLRPAVVSAADGAAVTPPSTSCGYAGAYTCRTTGNVIPNGPAFPLAARISPNLAGDNLNNLVFKLTARYHNMVYRLKFYHGSTLLSVPQPYATIDVTAKSGSLYRRVIAKKPLQITSAYNFLDSAIFSAKDICKDMQLDNNHNPVNGGNGKNTCDQ